MSTGQTTMTLGGASAMLAQIIFWLGHWPIQPISEDTATSLAGLIIIGVGYMAHRSSLPKAPQIEEHKP